jgi:hypothetical protein
VTMTAGEADRGGQLVVEDFFEGLGREVPTK